MLFNSHEFLLAFLPAALVLYRLVDNSPSFRTWVLVALSLVFYGYWDVRFLPLLVGSILVNWAASQVFKATKHHGVIVTAILANLALLGLFKYADFAIQNMSALIGVTLEQPHWALPLGISFFTFHHIMYLVDLGKGRAPVFPLDRYALYICFFPQAIAGPVARWNEVMHQFGQRAFAPGWEKRAALGATFIVVGLAQKCLLADPIARAIDPVFAQAMVGPIPRGEAWLALAIAFQIFFDFSGYSDIAIGLGLIFGVQLPLNFDGPFRATSIQQLWQRWHMTLARFLRDYVFVPLAGSGIGGRRYRVPRQLVAILLTMALCGLWHGAAWTFVLWGFLQGLAIVVAAVWSRNMPALPAVVAWGLTFGFFVVTGVIFRTESLEAAWRIYEGLAILPPANLPGRNTIILAFLCAVVLPPSHEICRRLTERSHPAIATGLGIAGIAALAAIGEDAANVFVYFRF